MMEVTGHCALQRILSCAKCYNFGVCICVVQPGVDPHPPQPRSDAASHGASQEPSSHERDDALTGQAANIEVPSSGCVMGGTATPQ